MTGRTFVAAHLAVGSHALESGGKADNWVQEGDIRVWWAES